MRIGSGSHTYEWNGKWAKLPAGVTLGYTHGVVADKDDNIYLHNTSEHAVIKFDNAGNYLASWGKDFAKGAHGMYLNTEGGKDYFYLADTARHAVYKTTVTGEPVYTINTPELPDVYPTPDKFVATDTAIAPNGDVYVCDGYGQSWVHVYDAAGKRKFSFGGKGAEAGKLDCPHGIWIDTRGGKDPECYVADRANSRIQVFTLEGKHKRFIQGMLRYPCCFWAHGSELIIPDLFGRVTILDGDDHLLINLGDTPELFDKPGWPGHIKGYPNIPHEDRKEGHFISPHAACADSKGNIYVAEWVSDGRITKLEKV